ncbi:MAG: hypothetical protein IJB74_03985 [Clostridia bacterium]|nr:hypothetical protein [Clostridia bacterium]
MQSTVEKEIKEYLSKIKNFLICDSKLKKSIITEIEESIYEFAETNGIRNIEEIEKHFGTPEDVAREYLSLIDPKLIKKAVSIKRFILYATVTALVIFVVFLVITYLDAREDFNVYFIDSLPEEISESLLIKIL